MIKWSTVQRGDSFTCRLIKHQGTKESDNVFGTWKKQLVTHIQFDGKGRATCITFTECPVEFDPRCDYNDGNEYPSLSCASYEIQFQYNRS